MNKIRGGYIIIIFTGDGKGKTSAALGIAFRASGWGKKTAIIQFIKGNKEVGEWKAIKNNKAIDVFQFIDDKSLYIGYPTQKHKDSMAKAILETKTIINSGKYQLIILDEINNALQHRLVELDNVIKLLHPNTDIDFILTGRGAPLKLIEMADCVTEMKKIKHPFDQKIIAKKGIDY